jgi:hypothetical protein
LAGFQRNINKSNNQFNEDDVTIGYELANAVYNKHLWDGISKQMLSLSNKKSDARSLEVYVETDKNNKIDTFQKRTN